MSQYKYLFQRGLSQGYTLKPMHSMLFQAEVQAQEVQSGLWLLHQALSLLQSSVTNTALQSHLDNSIRNLLSTNAVLRSLNFQVRLCVLSDDAMTLISSIVC